MKKSVPIAIVLALIFVVGQVAMNTFTCWTPETKASVWVACGTIALAIATFWSVWETRLVLGGEDRRHQESYAPIVTVEPHGGGWGSGIRGFYLRNTGLGPAVKPRIFYQGRIDHFVPKMVEKDGKSVRDGETFDKSEPFTVDQDLNQVIHAPGSRTIDLGGGVNEAVTRVGGGTTRVAFGNVQITYYDVFGNRYTTTYETFAIEGNNPYTWERPTIKARRDIT